MWANENWTRRWDGSDQDILISQDYRDADEAPLLAWYARCFADPRYIRLAGRPLLMIYRPRLIPDTAATIARWRRRFAGEHGEDPVFILVQSFGDLDPRPFGMDAAVEFPPHKLTHSLDTINHTLEILDPRFSAEAYDYEALVAASLNEPVPDYPLIKTAVPGWDNDARRQGQGTLLHGATPERYQVWLEGLIRHARANTVLGESIVCVNAWNEWAEGAYLEPDVHWGAAFLNATARAVAGLPRPGARTRILLVGHDAMDHGAQRLLLHIGRSLTAGHGVDVAFILLGGGVLEPAYREVAPVVVAASDQALDLLARAASAAGCQAALVNSVASARACAILARHGIASTLLVHELPQLIRQKGLQGDLRQGLATARSAVFPAAFVLDRCRDLLGLALPDALVLPQGLYAPATPGLAARAALRARWRIPAGAVVALGMGYADLRKGFDLFLQAWRAAAAGPHPMHLVWAGGMDPALQAYLGPEIAVAEAAGSFHYLGQRTDSADLFAAADVFLLTSREDPLPSVALEALSSGLPVVAFADTGGIPELLPGNGAAVTLGDAAAMAAAAWTLAAANTPARRAERASASQAAFRFAPYVQRLVTGALPGMRQVSVVVLSHNYAEYMPDRLASILAQTYPVHEVLVLDDASSDGSAAVAEQTAQAWKRTVTVVRQAANSGSVFAQWRRAAEQATGEWLWIAEADDTCDPHFLAGLAAALGQAANPVMAFCDSTAIDAAGNTLWPDHKAYYAADGPGTLAADAVFDGADFLARHLAERNLILNASAVLWRRDALLAALQRCGPELAKLRMIGDWRIYADILAQPGAQIAYVARPYNHHRRHPASVTARLDPASHLAEIRQVHDVVNQLLGGGAKLRGRQRRYRDALGLNAG